jgi:hypothetical protein
VNRTVRLVFALTTIAAANEIQDTLQELVLKIRSTPESQLDRLLTPSARKTMMPVMKELRLHARDGSAEPMSELSPPLLLIRAVVRNEPNRANACILVTRVGSLQNVTLAVYQLSAIQVDGGWQIEALSPSTPACTAKTDRVPSGGPE